MGLFRRRSAPADGTPKSIVAASLPLSGPDRVRVGRNFKAGRYDWQNEAWYYHDAVGEFRSAVGWVANAVSKAEVHAADVDPDTDQPGETTEDPRIQRIAAAVLGGAEQRPGLLRMLAVQWQIPGESFIIVRSTAAGRPDEWLVLSGRRVEYTGSSWRYLDPRTLQSVVLTGDSDLLMRVWSPHPDDPVQADSAARPALPILREIEKTSQAIAARLDSRLAVAGIQAIPQETELPAGSNGNLVDSLTDLLMETAAENIKNPGQSAARVPILITMPGEQIPNFANGFIDYATDFDEATVELREAALRRLAATLDMPNETAEGSTGGMNHWGAWQVEESTYKIYIEPLLGAIGDALTREWFRPALAAAGIARPERYVLAWDTSGIVARPDRQSELKELWDDLLISDDYRRQQAGIPDDAVPSEEEHRRRLLEQLVKTSPAILSEGVGTELGIEIEAPEPAPVTPAVEPADNVRALPAPPDAGEPPEGLVAAAEFAVFDALSRAGKRLLTREHRAQFGTHKAEELYLHIPHERQARELVEGSFAFIDGVEDAYGRERGDLRERLETYAIHLIQGKAPHRRDRLRTYL